MHDALPWLVAPLAGAALGVVFFTGLWWTTRSAATFRHPGVSLLCSLVLRMGLAMLGFYLVGGGHWERWLLCLAGFLLARGAVTRCVGRTRAVAGRAQPGARRAP